MKASSSPPSLRTMFRRLNTVPKMSLASFCARVVALALMVAGGCPFVGFAVAGLPLGSLMGGARWEGGSHVLV